MTTSALAGCIAGVHLLQVNRIMVIPHSRCAMAAADDDVIIDSIRNASEADASWVRFGASADQRRTLHRDVEKLGSPTCRRPSSCRRLLLRRRHRPPRTLGLVCALPSGVDGGSVWGVCTVNDELLAGAHVVAHQHLERRLGYKTVVNCHPAQSAVPGIHRRLGQLIGVHLAETLVALRLLEVQTPLGELCCLPWYSASE